MIHAARLDTEELIRIKTLGDLKAIGYKSRSIKDELRSNLILKLKKGETVFEGVLGYEDTVIPDLERAILSRHSINLLGLRGQAKTRIARAMVALLDEYIPVIEGSDLNDDPTDPITSFGQQVIAEHGDNTSVVWMHRNERYNEKLATPDVTVADLIGDVDPIKAANLNLDYADERVIHFGLVPRSHRCLFVINELPDLQPRIQVALFNILQEGDIQIRGFKLRLPLDVQFIFTANPEDYTNRGAIITPLKDRIQSQILTHYPRSVEVSQKITKQEAKIDPDADQIVTVMPLLETLVEQISFEARESEYVDQKSGVSARLTISAYESLVSAAERRALLNREAETCTRVGDLFGVVPAITGKMELVYEGEQEGALSVALLLMGKVIRNQFSQFFPDPEMIKRRKETNPYRPMIDWFTSNELELENDATQDEYEAGLKQIDGLQALVEKYHPNAERDEKLLLMEFALHGLAEHSLIGKQIMETGLTFQDLLNSVFSSDSNEYDE
jgi:magnesium chelatase subunit I